MSKALAFVNENYESVTLKENIPEKVNSPYCEMYGCTRPKKIKSYINGTVICDFCCEKCEKTAGVNHNETCSVGEKYKKLPKNPLHLCFKFEGIPATFIQ